MMHSAAWYGVRDFHLKYGHQVGEQPSHTISDEVLLLRERLILEELGELASAIHEKNYNQVADGLCDLLYVVLGTAVGYGIQIEDHFISPRDNKSEISPIMSARFLQYLTDLVSGLIHEMNLPKMTRYVNSLHYSLNKLCMNICEVGSSYKVPMEACFFEVHRSNMTKQAINAKNGEKYGSGKTAKGPDFSPPNLTQFLGV